MKTPALGAVSLHALAPLERVLFASSGDEPRRRRWADVVALVASGVAFWLAARLARGAGAGEDKVIAGLAAALGWLGPLWSALYASLSALCLAFVVGAIVGRRRILLRDMFGTAVLTFGVGLTVNRIVEHTWTSLSDALLKTGDPTFPELRLALAIAFVFVAAPDLTRPARRFSQWLAGLGVLSALVLQVGRPSDVLGGLALGFASAATIRVLFGTSAGFPSEARVERALVELGVPTRSLERATQQHQGVADYEAESTAGPLGVKMYGRDARDTQLVARLWRFLWYRDARVLLSFTRLQLVEHEALMLLVAASRGVRVPAVVAAGTSTTGDALLVTRRPAAPRLADTDPSAIDDARLGRVFDELAKLRAAAIGHGHLNAGSVLLEDDHVTIADFEGAQLSATDTRLNSDLAELLVSVALLVGADRAIAVASARLGDHVVDQALPYLQPAALTPELREMVRQERFDIDAMRTNIGRRNAVELPEMARLRRVSLRRVVLLAFVGIAAYTLIAQLADVGLQTVWDTLTSAKIGWVILAVLLASATLVPDAIATKSIVAAELPLGPTTLLQSAIKFVNLTVPSAAGKIALNIRYLQRQGVDATTSVTQGALDSFAGFIVQALLLLILLPGADFHFDVSGDIDKERLLKLGAIVLGVVVVVLVVLACRRSVRRRVVPVIKSARTTLSTVLRSPRRAASLLAANFGSQLLFALCLGASLRAFDTHVGLANLLLINTGVSLFAGLMPVPGGIGVAEAGFVAALTAIGVEPDIALAGTLVHRMASYYLPPVPGFFSLRWLGRHGYV